MNNESIYSRLETILKEKKRFTSPKDEYNRRFNYCLSLLRDEYKRILIESYIDVKYTFWWIEDYCKSSYYRKRIRAITSFVSLFETMYENNIPVRASYNFACCY